MFSKELLKGTLSAIILKLLAEHGKMYGYEIVQHVHEQSGKKILIKDGSLYPCLQKLTEDGVLSFKEEMVNGRIRKYYYLTASGKKATRAYLSELDDFISTINQIVFSENKPKLA